VVGGRVSHEGAVVSSGWRDAVLGAGAGQTTRDGRSKPNDIPLGPYAVDDSFRRWGDVLMGLESIPTKGGRREKTPKVVGWWGRGKKRKTRQFQIKGYVNGGIKMGVSAYVQGRETDKSGVGANEVTYPSLPSDKIGKGELPQQAPPPTPGTENGKGKRLPGSKREPTEKK